MCPILGVHLIPQPAMPIRTSIKNHKTTNTRLKIVTPIKAQKKLERAFTLAAIIKVTEEEISNENGKNMIKYPKNPNHNSNHAG